MFSFMLAQAGQQPAPPNPLVTLGPLVLLLVIMYLLLIRPQQKKAKEHQQMVTRLKAGDEVVTNGGFHGTITGVQDRFVKLQLADNVEVAVLKTAIASVLNQGTGTEKKS